LSTALVKFKSFSTSNTSHDARVVVVDSVASPAAMDADAVLSAISLSMLRLAYSPEVLVGLGLLVVPGLTLPSYLYSISTGIVDYEPFAQGVASKRWVVENICLLFLAMSEAAVLLLRAFGAHIDGAAASLPVPFLVAVLAVTVGCSAALEFVL
jgi:hypothetical protein